MQTILAGGVPNNLTHSLELKKSHTQLAGMFRQLRLITSKGNATAKKDHKSIYWRILSYTHKKCWFYETWATVQERLRKRKHWNLFFFFPLLNPWVGSATWRAWFLLVFSKVPPPSLLSFTLLCGAERQDRKANWTRRDPGPNQWPPSVHHHLSHAFQLDCVSLIQNSLLGEENLASDNGFAKMTPNTWSLKLCLFVSQNCPNWWQHRHFQSEEGSLALAHDQHSQFLPAHGSWLHSDFQIRMNNMHNSQSRRLLKPHV